VDVPEDVQLWLNPINGFAEFEAASVVLGSTNRV
jgi:hypothetical protein